MYLAYMIGNDDGHGPLLGEFETAEQAKKCCADKEKEMRSTLPMEHQQQIAHDFKNYEMEWTQDGPTVFSSTTLPPLTWPGIRGAVCFKVQELRE